MGYLILHDSRYLLIRFLPTTSSSNLHTHTQTPTHQVLRVRKVAPFEAILSYPIHPHFHFCNLPPPALPISSTSIMSELSLVATPPSVDSRTPRGDFPPELVREIAENLAGDFKALLTFSLLCHHWRNASRPILFTKVNIRNPQRLEEFIAIINEDPSIAYQARELVLGRPLDFETRWFQGIDSTLGKRLPNLTKLQIYGLRFYSIKDDPTLTRLKIFQDLISGFSSLDSLKISISVLPSNIMPKILTYAKKLKTLSFDACFPIFVDPDAEDEEDELSADKGAIETVPKDRSLGTSVHFGWPLVNSYELTDMASYLAFQFFVIRSSGPHKTIKLSVPGSSWRELALSTVEDIIDQHKYTLEDLTLEIPTHSTLSNSESLSKLILQFFVCVFIAHSYGYFQKSRHHWAKNFDAYHVSNTSISKIPSCSSSIKLWISSIPINSRMSLSLLGRNTSRTSTSISRLMFAEAWISSFPQRRTNHLLVSSLQPVDRRTQWSYSGLDFLACLLNNGFVSGKVTRCTVLRVNENSDCM